MIWNHETDRFESKTEVPHHMSKEMISWIPVGDGGVCLDVGCGKAAPRALINSMRYRYIGVDVNRNYDVYGDAHNLPFENNYADLVLSIAAIEHFKDPFRAVREMHRVLKPGGCVVGATAFIQPYHDSYFNMSREGVQVLLSRFCNVEIKPTRDGIYNLCRQAYFRGSPGFLHSGMARLFLVASRAWWLAASLYNRKATEQKRRDLTAAGFIFKAEKPIIIG